MEDCWGDVRCFIIQFWMFVGRMTRGFVDGFDMMFSDEICLGVILSVQHSTHDLSNTTHNAYITPM